VLHYVCIDAPRASFIGEEEPREPGPDEISVESILSGISAGTEMAVYRGSLSNLRTKRWGYWTDYPIRPGYQLVGRVDRCGERVGDVRPGDRVVCHAPHASRATVQYDDYVAIPDSVSSEEATFAMLGATTAHGIRRTGVSPGESVLVFGLGVVGWLSAEQARIGGARVLIADPLDWKRAFASDRGYASLDPARAGFAEEVFEQTDGRGADLVIEASGTSGAIQSALVTVRREGRILIQGTQCTPVSIDFGDYALHREVTLICTWGKGRPDSMDHTPQSSVTGVSGHPDVRKANQQYAMDLIARGMVRTDGLVTHRFPFSRAPEVYASIESGRLDYMQVILEY